MMKIERPLFKSRYLLRLVGCAMSAILLFGCSKAPTSSPSQQQSSSASTIAPEELLANLRATYSNASSYSDNAMLQMRGVNRSRGTLTEMPFTRLSLLFARPNRYAISYEDALPSSQGSTKYQVVSDGRRVRSSASQLPEQIHEAIAPHQTTIDNLIPEPELRSVIFQVAIENLFPQLAMLLTEDPQQPIFPRATKMEMLPDGNIGESVYYRLSLVEPEGNRILWIDKESFVLRRMQIPIEGQRELLDPAGQFADFSVDLDFSNITLDAEFAETSLALDVPEGGRLVRRFIPPPPPGPSEVLGKPIKEFKFTDAAGNEITPSSMAGKIMVLDFWATDCAPCKENTPRLEEAYQQLKDDSDVAFFAVSTDPKGLPQATIDRTLEAWGATFPSLRDLDKTSYYELDVQATPTLMIVGPDRRLEAIHLGPVDSAESLVSKIRKLRDDGDLVKDAREQHARQLEQHRAIVEAATLERSLIEDKSAPPQPSARSYPSNLKLAELWESNVDDLTEPVNVVGLTNTEDTLEEVLVLDGGTAVVRYDPAGQCLGRVELPEHAESTDGFIRTARDGEGNRSHLVSGLGWQQVFLYDDEWNLRFAFPDEPHSGVADARLVTPEADSLPPVIVGYWGGHGVQAGTLSGERVWVNRHLDHVWQVQAVSTASGQSLWCTSTRGTVLQIDSGGQLQRELVVPGHTMVSLAPAARDHHSGHHGLSLTKPGQYAVVAFDEQGEVQWQFTLPEGEFAAAVPQLERISLPGHADALLAVGPEGSLCFIAADGELIDQFAYGQYVSDVAIAPASGGAAVFVAAGDRLTAWQIETDRAP